METNFYKCNICGQIVEMIDETGVPLICCGQAMEELRPGTTDAAVEKHIPVYTIKDGVVRVEVGSEPHPMDDIHYIQWIAIRTNYGSQLRELKPGQPPKAVFYINDGDEIRAVYAYCNLHGLWRALE